MKDKNESFMHYQAKVIFASWLREKAIFDDWVNMAEISWRVNRGAPFYGIYEEYPIVENTGDCCEVWDEKHWWCNDKKCEEFYNGDENCKTEVPIKDWPDYKWMKKNHKGNFKIADIVIQHKGAVRYVIEIVHKNSISEEKKEFYKDKNFCVLEIPAHWIMGQTGIPENIPKEFFLNLAE